MNWSSDIYYIYTFYLHLHVFTNFVKQLPVEFFSPQKKRCRRQALEAEYRASLEVFNAMKVCRSILHAKVVDLPLMVQKIQLSKISGLGSLTIHMLLVHFKLVSWEPDFYRDAGSSFCSCTSSLWSTGLRDGRWVAEDLLEDLWPLSILAPEVMMRCALLFGMGSLPCHLFFFWHWDCRIVTGVGPWNLPWILGLKCRTWIWHKLHETNSSRIDACNVHKILLAKKDIFFDVLSSSTFLFFFKQILTRKNILATIWWFQIDIKHGSATQQRLLSYLNAHVAIFPRSFGELAAGQDSSTLIDRCAPPWIPPVKSHGFYQKNPLWHYPNTWGKTWV